ncbi:hypothetical protein DKX38_004849 [Salix brachista]|uniref:Uncharacterized protein n=1 Tax=Salix brachista TaxID=2182728 RepID=A0A5N5NB23_9ROSI|nr:hypothetical protein DKX38_004849 [Salix brachista]
MIVEMHAQSAVTDSSKSYRAWTCHQGLATVATKCYQFCCSHQWTLNLESISTILVFRIPPPYPQPDFHPPPVPAPPPPGYQSYFHEGPAPPPLPPPSHAYHARHDHGESSGCCSFLRGCSDGSNYRDLDT